MPRPALVEQYIDGREFNVAVIERRGLEVLPIAEIRFDGLLAGALRLVGYQAKWQPRHEYYRNTTPQCPARLPGAGRPGLARGALRAWTAAGLRGYARFDFRMDRRGRIYLLEINPNPDTSLDAGRRARWPRRTSGMPISGAPRSGRPGAESARRGMLIRPMLDAADRDALREVIRATDMFTAEEEKVAVELMDTFLEQPCQSDYIVDVLEDDAGRPAGYVCYGPTPMTEGTFDLYWIAVRIRPPSTGRQGFAAREKTPLNKKRESHCDRDVFTRQV